VNLSGTTATFAALSVEESYPNPSRVNSPVNIPVTAPTGASGVSVEILDSGNRRVRRMEVGDLAAGTQNIVWDGRNDAGRLCAPGVYRGWVISAQGRQSLRLVRVP
jgi:flagellar hook assembly protein FlgD